MNSNWSEEKKEHVMLIKQTDHSLTILLERLPTTGLPSLIFQYDDEKKWDKIRYIINIVIRIGAYGINSWG